MFLKKVQAAKGTYSPSTTGSTYDGWFNVILGDMDASIAKVKGIAANMMILKDDVPFAKIKDRVEEMLEELNKFK